MTKGKEFSIIWMKYFLVDNCVDCSRIVSVRPRKEIYVCQIILRAEQGGLEQGLRACSLISWHISKHWHWLWQIDTQQLSTFQTQQHNCILTWFVEFSDFVLFDNKRYNLGYQAQNCYLFPFIKIFNTKIKSWNNQHHNRMQTTGLHGVLLVKPF